MPALLDSSVLELLCLIAGLVVGQFLIVSIRLAEHAGWYILRAAKRVPLVLAANFALQLAAGAILLRYAGSGPAEAFLLGGVVSFGFLGPEVLSAALGPEVPLAKGVLGLLRRIRLAVIFLLECQIQKLMEADNFAWQASDGDWDFGVSWKETGRRLRKLYECKKVEIANRRKAPWLMRSDIGSFPGGKFYPLVKAVGRGELRRLLSAPIAPPSTEWDGRERRRERKHSSGRRSYDDEGLMRRIRQGRALPLGRYHRRRAAMLNEPSDGAPRPPKSPEPEKASKKPA